MKKRPTSRNLLSLLILSMGLLLGWLLINPAYSHEEDYSSGPYLPTLAIKPTQATDGYVGQLAKPITNNAVASAKTSAGWQLFSFNGLQPGKDYQAVSHLAMQFDLDSGKSTVIDNVPFKAGRLASIAATVNNQIYLFGGYTVSKDHQEVSMTDVYRFDPSHQAFSLFSQMPTSVDDSVALVYQDRYIYLVSGWHNEGNISDVQILDTQTKQWFKGTPFPGKPVFGHAAGIVGHQMVIVDGVKVAAIIDGKRQYKMSPESYIGAIDKHDFRKIAWQTLPSHPGKAKYRMAATGVVAKGKIIFANGSDNPYNYNGIGYNGTPSKPANEVFAWDIKSASWQRLAPFAFASMDHRAMIAINNTLYIVGGMSAHQQVSAKVLSYTIN
ncbi:MAG: N-acetylneuraminic acid mutarotase [Alteromonadaceae bacterium]|jgi:N-acetylneuraminic acid mutarotase